MENKLNMKLKVIFLTAIFSLCSYCIFTSEKKNYSDISMCNIEALAFGESSTVKCQGIGSVDCPISNSKVYAVFSNR